MPQVVGHQQVAAVAHEQHRLLLFLGSGFVVIPPHRDRAQRQVNIGIGELLKIQLIAHIRRVPLQIGAKLALGENVPPMLVEKFAHVISLHPIGGSRERGALRCLGLGCLPRAGIHLRQRVLKHRLLNVGAGGADVALQALQRPKVCLKREQFQHRLGNS